MSPTPTTHAAWQTLNAHAQEMRPQHLRTLFAEQPGRFDSFSLQHEDLLLDFSKQRVTADTLNHLHALAQAANLQAWQQRMLAGESINHTENRAVQHTALRVPTGVSSNPEVVTLLPEVRQAREQMGRFCTSVHDGHWRGCSNQPITDVVNLGIGGSDLGPRMAARALGAFHQPDLRVHFVSNVDGADLAPLLARLDPRTTLFVVVSKTFSTQETLINARSAREWLLANVHDESAVARHFVAVTSNVQEAAQFGIPVDNTFQFQEWVGGRFSLWSSVGLSLALAIGFHHFEALLAGAHSLDRHFFTAPPRENLPLTLALLDIWNTSCLGATTHAILPYSQSLELLPAHLQQLEMESTGKTVDRQGLAVASATCPIIFGSAGTNGQHSFYQLLHQGGRLIPCDFILLKEADFPLPGHHVRLLANGLAQSAALAFGQTAEEARLAGTPENLVPFKVFPGNQPSSTLILPKLTPYTLGQLIALYEHKVFCQGVLWNLNAFDQWGVELGKQMAGSLLACLEERLDPDRFDVSTRGLLAALA